MSRILVHDPRRSSIDRVELPALPGHEWTVCRDHKALLAALTECRPAVLIHVLDDLGRDVELLAALRQYAPRLPIILLGEPASLEVRRVIQELRPTYYGVLPLDRLELEEAVEGALGVGRPPASRGVPAA